MLSPSILGLVLSHFSKSSFYFLPFWARVVFISVNSPSMISQVLSLSPLLFGFFNLLNNNNIYLIKITLSKVQFGHIGLTVISYIAVNILIKLKSDPNPF